MSSSANTNSSGFSVRAWVGDTKTLLAFDMPQQQAKRLGGFTIQCQPQGKNPYYLFNNLAFEHPEQHAHDPAQPSNTSLNAPYQKFRWLHVPGSMHQGIDPFRGPYTYVVTPRYFDAKGSLQPLDQSQSVSVQVDVVPFKTKQVQLAFTRGYQQSQAFVRHFGSKANIRPKGKELLFDTSQVAGTSADGTTYTYADEYRWQGFTARELVFDILNQVVGDEKLHLDVFAYDLNEPDVLKIFLELAKQGRIRVILDNASLHHVAKPPLKNEDQFEQAFKKAAQGDAAILRGKFGRFAHDKILVVSDPNGPIRVLTGSTNFAVTGLYVNSNHVLSFTDPKVTGAYQQLFDDVWKGKVAENAFLASPLASGAVSVDTAQTPPTDFTFSPHSKDNATEILDGIAARIQEEGTKEGGSVLFAVMQMDRGESPVFTALTKLHSNQSIFSYGVSDSPGGIELYDPGKATGVLVTGKPTATKLPPPFNQVPGVAGHQIHHKFVVCGFNRDDAIVYCGSSNLALGGEQLNGDNLLAIRDPDIATAFAIEAVSLVDHFQFLDRFSKPQAPAPVSLRETAKEAGAFLATDDSWTSKYFDPKDLHFLDRQLFA
jgi:hypothetical protein